MKSRDSLGRHRSTSGRWSRSRRNRRFTPAALARVDGLLAKKWSPEQIAGYLRRQRELHISHETIYRHVWRDRRGWTQPYRRWLADLSFPRQRAFGHPDPANTSSYVIT